MCLATTFITMVVQEKKMWNIVYFLHLFLLKVKGIQPSTSLLFSSAVSGMHIRNHMRRANAAGLWPKVERQCCLLWGSYLLSRSHLAVRCLARLSKLTKKTLMTPRPMRTSKRLPVKERSCSGVSTGGTLTKTWPVSKKPQAVFVRAHNRCLLCRLWEFLR